SGKIRQRNSHALYGHSGAHGCSLKRFQGREGVAKNKTFNPVFVLDFLKYVDPAVFWPHFIRPMRMDMETYAEGIVHDFSSRNSTHGREGDFRFSQGLL